MTIRVYRSWAEILAGDYLCAEWEDVDFEPRAAEDRISPAGFRRRRRAPREVAIEVPMGARLVDRGGRRRLSVYFYPRGIDAHAALAYATKGEHQFSLATEDTMGKKRDDGPTLFGGDDREPTASAYPRAVAVAPASPAPPASEAVPAWLRPRLREIAAEVLAEERAAQERRLAGQVERALAELTAAIESGEPARMVTARAILQCALEDAGRTSAA